jgi:isopropylmalate/homocitrate/citramalate synthase
MIDPTLIWTGDINAGVTGGTDLPERVGLYDTTLRDGEQTVGVALGPKSKLEIAHALDRLGVDRIEAGFARVSQDDEEAYRLILDAGLKAEIWGFARAVPADIRQLIDLGVPATVIESPVSENKLAAYGLDRDEVTKRVTAAVSLAAKNDMTVCFFAVDSTRSDLVFLEKIYLAALDAGAREVAVVDTIGIAAPETVEQLMGQVRKWIGPGIPLHWHGHNDFGLATAGSIAAVKGGATWIQGTVNGMGERAGNTNIAEFALAVEALYSVETGLHFEEIIEVARLVQEQSGYSLEPWKPVTGENLFIRESGAVAMQFHEPSAVEPYSSDLVKAVRAIVLGKKSGLASIRIKLDELGLDVADEHLAPLLDRVKRLGSTKEGLVTDSEFRALVSEITSAGREDTSPRSEV